MAAASTPRLILASASPRRLALLQQIGLNPDQVVAADVDEAALAGELPAAMAERLAMAKAQRIGGTHDNAVVLAADTVVACGRRVLPKPADAMGAQRCLETLSGRRHRVHTGVAVVAPGGPCRHRLVTTIVHLKRLGEADIRDYIASDEWRGKAGGYAIQGRAAAWVRRINGSYTNIVGLPLYETVNLLDGIGFPVHRRAMPEPADLRLAALRP